MIRNHTTFAEDVTHSFRMAIMVLSALMAILFSGHYVGLIETTYFPVVGEITIETTLETNSGVMISASADKVRDCSWRKTVFYLGDRDGNNVFLTESPHLDKPKVNGKGKLKWEKIFIPGIEVSQVDQTFADAYHRCHPFYDTRSYYWK